MEQKEQKQQKPVVQAAPKKVESENFRHIVRIMNTDLKGDKHILDALRQIKGVGFMFANAVCVIANLDKSKRAGDLSDKEIESINTVLNNPTSTLPSWMFNRKKDFETGNDTHLFTSDLDFVQDNDIKMMKKIKSYKGYRHAYGQPVRGQRTRSNFRKNKGKVMGVHRSRGAKQGKV